MAIKRIKARQHTVEDPDAVLCDTHKIAMKFVPAQGYWVCEFPDCDKRKYPSVDIEEAGIPIVGQGPLELMIYKDSHAPTGKSIILRSRVNNVIMDVTQYFVRAGRNEQTGEMDVTLKMDKILDADGITRKNFFGE